MNETETKIESPCRRVCFLAEDLTYCRGCGRTTEQIRRWWMLTDAEKLSVLEDAETRIDHTLPSSNG